MEIAKQAKKVHFEFEMNGRTATISFYYTGKVAYYQTKKSSYEVYFGIDGRIIKKFGRTLSYPTISAAWQYVISYGVKNIEIYRDDVYYCTVCKAVAVDALNGFDTCESCAAKL